MATRSFLHGVAVSPAGTVLPGATVRARVAPLGGGGGVSPIVTVPANDVEILSPEETQCDDTTGAWSLQLWGTDDIAPSGTVYEITYKRGTTRYAPLYVDLPGGGGSHWIGDRIVDGPSEPNQRTLESVEVTPVGSSIVAGDTLQLTATGHYSDGTTANLTSSCTWTTNAAGVATVGDGAGTKGLVTGVDDGGATITATDLATGLVGTTTVAVTDAAPDTFLFIGGDQVRYTGMTTTDIDEMVADGIQWVRATVDFQVLGAAGNGGSPTAGIDLTLGGAAWPIIYAHSVGLKVLACCTYCPTWLSGGYHLIPQNSTQRANWVALLQALMGSALYDSIDAIELWNEPNHFPFNGAGTTLAPTAVPTMTTLRPWMRSAVLGARAVDPDAVLITGGLASARTRGPASGLDARVPKWDDGTEVASATDLSLAIAHTLDGWYAPNGGAPDGTGLDPGTTPGTAWINGLGIHGYCGTFPPNFVHMGIARYHAWNNVPNVGAPADWGTAGYNYYDDILTAREGGPGHGKTIWQTEGGWFGGFPGLDEGTAANYTLMACVDWREHQRLGQAGPDINFEHTNNGQSNPTTRAALGTNSEDYLGMRHRFPDGTRAEKAQLAAFRALCTVPG